MKVTIKGEEKEVVFSQIYTRKIDREYNQIMLAWMKATPQQLQTGWIEISLDRVQNANDYLITAMTNLSQDELDELTVADYNAIMEKVEALKIPS